MDNFFDSIFASEMSAWRVFVALGSALLIGVAVSWICSFRLRSSRGTFITGAIMPVVIAAVFVFSELLVSSISTDSSAAYAPRILTIAVAFGLLRFRSVNARAEEVLFLFFSVFLFRRLPVFNVLNNVFCLGDQAVQIAADSRSSVTESGYFLSPFPVLGDIAFIL